MPPLIKSLNLFLDANGLLRSKGRISKCLALEYDTVNPLLLSKHSLFTLLLIKESQFKCKHLGVGSTLNHLRQSGFWLPSARTTIKKVIKQCIICNKYNNLAFNLSNTPALPSDRVNYEYPFQHAGIDLPAISLKGDNNDGQKG